MVSPHVNITSFVRHLDLNVHCQDHVILILAGVLNQSPSTNYGSSDEKKTMSRWCDPVSSRCIFGIIPLSFPLLFEFLILISQV